MVEEYNLADIEYEKWDAALDDFNSAKAGLPDLRFESWYHQQKHFVKQASQVKQEYDDEPIDEENQIHYISSGVLAELLYNLHKKANELYEEYDEDEWDAWDEDAENDENLL